MSRAGVCHVITMLELGGAQQNTLYTVAHLDRMRFAPSLLAGPGGALDGDARALVDVTFETVPHLVRPIAPVADLRAFFELRGALRRIAPAIVHTHSSKAGILGRAAAASLGVPVIVHTVHGWGFHPHQSRVTRALYVALERAAAKATTALVAVSHANAADGARYRVAPREAFEVIRSGIALADHRQAAGNGRLRAELGLAADVPLAGMVACLKPQKAPLDFVAVAAAAARAVPLAHFVLAGDGELRGPVEAAVRDAGLGARFHVLGWRRDPQAVIGDLDVLVLTSLHEGLPRVVPEAMAAGKPVIATAVDGTPEAVHDGASGALFAPHDVEGMAAALARLLADPATARRMGERGRAAAAAWDIDAMVRAQESLYERLLRQTGLAAESGVVR